MNEPNGTPPAAGKGSDIFDWLVILLPLGLGPALVLTDAKSAFTYFFIIPSVVAIMNGGLKPTGGLQRVKWAYRRQYKFDIGYDIVVGMALLSLVPGAILWIVLKLLG